MVEISYDEYSEQADLAGKSVAEVREQYKAEFNIPGKAKARLNDKEVKKKLEPRVMLNEGDELSFEVKERSKMPFFVTAVMLALAITGGLFAYTQTTASLDLLITAEEDFAKAEAFGTKPTWTVFGKYVGRTGSGDLFKITPASGFTGDLGTSLYIANGDELVEVYRVLSFKIQVEGIDSSDNTTGTETGLLTLSKGELYVDLTDINCGDLGTYEVTVTSGFFVTHAWGANKPTGEEDPTIYIDIFQKGAM